MSKPYSKSVKSKGLGGAGNLGSSIGLGANLETLKYQNQAALPTQSENDAQLFADIGKSFSAPGDRPRGGARNLGAGFAKGLEYGSKSNAIAERKDNFNKYENVMNYLQEVNNSTIEQNQWHEKREGARKEMMPQVLAYMDNIDRLDPQSQRIMAQDMLGQYGESIGEDFKLSSIDGSNPFLMTVQSEKGQQLFDLRSLFAGDEAMQQSIAMKMPEYQMKLQEERQNKQREFELKQDKIDVLKHKQGISGGAYGTKNENANNPYGSIPLENLKTGGGGRAFMNTLNSEINLAKDIPIVLDQLQEAEDIIKANPAIGTSWNNWVSKGSFSKGFMDKDLRHAYEKLGKIAARVEETYVKAKGSSITDAERETIKKGLFDTSLQGRSSQFNINSVRKELAIAAQRGEFAADELLNGRVATSSSFNKFINSQGQQSSSNEGSNSWEQLGNKIQ
ncbi:MAG: hypothetical protein QN834_08315 [Nitrososphaeraceae archaeon]|nr:hypothetical protein [Nitrososphaeraceae archaeon]